LKGKKLVFSVNISHVNMARIRFVQSGRAPKKIIVQTQISQYRVENFAQKNNRTYTFIRNFRVVLTANVNSEVLKTIDGKLQ